MENLFGKAEEALDKFMSDPEKVEKAREKAEGVLEKHMDAQSARQVTGAAETILENLAHHKHQAEDEPRY